MATPTEQLRDVLALLEGRDVRRLQVGDVVVEFGPPAAPVVNGHAKSAALSDIVQAIQGPKRALYEDPFLYSDRPGPNPDEIVPHFPAVDVASHGPLSERQETSD